MTINGTEIQNSIIKTAVGFLTVTILGVGVMAFKVPFENKRAIEGNTNNDTLRDQRNSIQYQIIIDKLDELKQENKAIKQEIKELHR